ncbi:TerB family tellurite resistance protein [Flexithrix dorotheae]|uniref:tellurite resistance TerB family protein n=1 Tax=Flexithrix dorotheae TaxID=70993 RepID=UPI0003A6E6A5|nr:TerB family tellurite resistance protein [Flexithrix dorotheae]
MNNILLNFGKQERVSYLVALSTLAMADGEVEEGEVKLIQTMCENSELDGKETGVVMAAVYAPDNVDLVSHLDNLTSSDLRFSLMTDILLLVNADGELEEEEIAQVAQLKLRLNISNEQYATLGQYVNALQTFKNKGALDGQFLKEVGLESVFQKHGIPIAAFEAGNTVGQVLTNVALGVVEKQLEGTKAGAILGVAKELGLFSGKRKNRKNKKKKKKSKFGKFLAKVVSTPINHAA